MFLLQLNPGFVVNLTDTNFLKHIKECSVITLPMRGGEKQWIE
jgi:hypothetical protein